MAQGQVAFTQAHGLPPPTAPPGYTAKFIGSGPSTIPATIGGTGKPNPLFVASILDYYTFVQSVAPLTPAKSDDLLPFVYSPGGRTVTTLKTSPAPVAVQGEQLAGAGFNWTGLVLLGGIVGAAYTLFRHGSGEVAS